MDVVDNGLCHQVAEEEGDESKSCQQVTVKVEEEEPPVTTTMPVPAPAEATTSGGMKITPEGVRADGKLSLASFHEGLKGASWDDWDLPETVGQAELQGLRTKMSKRMGICPIKGIHKNDEPSRIPRRFMYLFGSYPMDDLFSVSQCRHCGHFCKTQHFPIHLEKECLKKPANLDLGSDDEEAEGENVEAEEEEEVPGSPVSEAGSDYQSDHRRSRSNSSNSSRSDSERRSPYSRSNSHSRSQSRSRSRTRSPSRSRSVSPEEGDRSSVSSAGSEPRYRSRSRGSSRSRSRSRSRSGTPTSSPEHESFAEETDEIDGESQDYYEEAEENEQIQEDEISPVESPEPYYEILPHISQASPADADITTRDLKTYPGCQVLSPSSANSLVPNPASHSSVKSDPDLEEEPIQFPLLLGDLNSAGGSGFDPIGNPVDPLELESAGTSVETADGSPSSLVFSNVGTPSLPNQKAAKKKKKKLRDEPRKIIPLKDRCFNPEEHCGVNNADGVPCTRSLTCKSHSMASRRAVPGRSQSFDVLLASHKKARDEAKAAKAGPADVSEDYVNDVKPTLHPTENKPPVPILSWTSPTTVKITLTNMLRGGIMNGPNPKTAKGGKTGQKANSAGGAKKGGKGISKESVRPVAGENSTEANDDESRLDATLYGNQSVFLRNPLDWSDDDDVNELDWDFVPLTKVQPTNPQEPDQGIMAAISGLSLGQVSEIQGAGRRMQLTSRQLMGFEESSNSATTSENYESPRTAFEQNNSRKRPISPASNLTTAARAPVKRRRPDGSFEPANLPQSTLSSLASQLPNPTKPPRAQPSESFGSAANQRVNLGAAATEVSLKDFPLQLVSASGSPPISLASLLGIRPQLKHDLPKLNLSSIVPAPATVTSPTPRATGNITGRTQPRKQQFPTVKAGPRPAAPSAPGISSQAITVKIPVKRGGVSPAICLVNPEQQSQQSQFGHYQLHLPEETRSPSPAATTTVGVGGTTLTAAQQRERSIAALQKQLHLQQALSVIKQEPGLGSPLTQQRGTATSSTTRFGEYTLQLPEQQGSSILPGDNSWASLSQERSGQRRLEDAPVADSELSKLLASQFEFED